jgi:shikimate kinase
MGMNEDRNIVLIGMPGVGKSTVGVLLAKRMGYDFLDTDILIQALEGRSLQEIIRAEGTRRFRALEEEYICDVQCTAHVIATGGSVVYSDRAMAHLARSGTVVFLDISLERLLHRLDDVDARGVVRAPGQTIADLYEERYPLYRRHHDIAVRTDGLAPNQVLAAILRRLPGLP